MEEAKHEAAELMKRKKRDDIKKALELRDAKNASEAEAAASEAEGEPGTPKSPPGAEPGTPKARGSKMNIDAVMQAQAKVEASQELGRVLENAWNGLDFATILQDEHQTKTATPQHFSS